MSSRAKASFVFAANAALLGILAANVQRIDFDRGLHIACMATAALLLAAGCYFVYRCSVGRRSSATCEPQAKIGLFTGIIRRAVLSTNFTLSRKEWSICHRLLGKYYPQ